MQNLMKKSGLKLLAGAAVAGLMTVSTASAALLIDVRVAGTGLKNATIAEGQSVNLEIYLVGANTDLANGLGSAVTSIRSFNETANDVAWSPAPTASNTVVNSSGGS